MATDYALYLESGPQRRKTMVHVLDLLGCVAVGPITEEAVEATPYAIAAFLRFLQRAGEEVDASASFATHVEEHITEGTWLGNGDPYISFKPDMAPLSKGELVLLVNRVVCLRQELASWVEASSARDLDVTVEGSSRSSRAILLHVQGPTGAYVSPVVGTIRGVSALRTRAERGDLPLAEALRQSMAIVAERLLGATDAQRTQPVVRPKEVRTLRKALRRTLEHEWEHMAELSRRPGGPNI